MLITHRLYEQFNTGERNSITSKSGMSGLIAMNEQDVSDYRLNNESIRISTPFGSVVSSVKICPRFF